MSSGVAELDVPPLHQAPAVGYIQLHFPLKNLGLDLAEGKETTPGFGLCSVSSTPVFTLILLSKMVVLVLGVQCSGLVIEGSLTDLTEKSWTIPVLYKEKKVGHGVIHPAEVSVLPWEFG